MKKIIFLTMSAAFITAGAFAQSYGNNAGSTQTTVSPNSRAKDATDKLNSIVQLSQDQYTKVLQVNQTFFSQSQSMGTGRRAAGLANERQQQLKTILDGNQWQMYQNARAQGQLP